MYRSSKGAVAGRRPLVPYVCLAVVLIYRAQSQSETNATTDAYEAGVLNSIFSKWKITADTTQWNTTGDPCSGAALGFDPKIDDLNYNPFIKCDCSFHNPTTCRITALKVYQKDVSGPIPDELWTLSHLTNLNLGRNVLTGNLSSSIRNLTRMQWLNFGLNSLSGEVPEELGLLSDLRSLSISSNKFSGPLPSSLGNLTKLQKLYIDSSGVSGVIPPSFANLGNLETVWASDVELTGTIPDFIGNWSSLQTLRFEGSSFQGPIPSALSNLTSLTELRISDISNESSSLGFIKNMKSLTTLVLRNVNIFDVIPSNIGEFQNLTQFKFVDQERNTLVFHRDLSFNSINGQISDSLFNLSSLSYLFLGNNKLNGTLPSFKSSSLTNIDISYNNLGGSLPSWVNQQNLQLNLIANNFTIEEGNISGLPSGLACLQRGYPCHKHPPVYSEFAIKCGGQQMTSSSDIFYESDNETLGPTTYYVTDATRWGVSNVGYFTGSTNHQYTVASSSQFTNTMDSELFQTARISASSLRYYGLGLENGKYTILLQFAETTIDNGNTWKSLGRRVFDVYIQESRVLKDFDIRKEAGGTSFRAVQRSFNATVIDNYLDIHLLWAGKGTCCIPTQGTYGPLISAISVKSDFPSSVSNKLPSDKNSKTGLIVGIAVGVGSLCFAFGLLVYVAVERRKSRLAFVDKELQGIDNKPYIFSYAGLKAATEDFSPANKLGEGGFGPVYKGQLSDGKVIAVKQLSVASRQGKRQFVTEIATISAVQHRNLVKLYGCCIEGDNRLLVYEYLENKSLDQALFGEHCLDLDWATRYEICLGVAKGLAYLHEESRVKIVHRDVKASNILLDSDLVPKISDFGLAKLFDDKKSHTSTRVAGTIGYVSPEYAMRGHLTEKADVFSYGVVVLEVISGRPNSDMNLEGEKIYLLEWTWNLREKRQEVDLVDSRLSEYNAEEVKRLIDVALLCTQTSLAVRPTMSRVVGMVCGDIEVESVTAKPGYLTGWQFEDISSSFMTGIATIPSEETNYRNFFTSTTILQPNSTLPSPASPTNPMLY